MLGGEIQEDATETAANVAGVHLMGERATVQAREAMICYIPTRLKRVKSLRLQSI
ncbi:MAG TPA: hypothetical protein VHJ59_02500 [Nitrososphaera sp.]|nr:hypothetical protein [Nitrososphaera sp.]